MFLLLSKTLDKFVSPFAWAMALALFGWLLRAKKPKLAGALSLSSLLVLVVGGFGPVADGLFRGLERSARTTMRPDVTYDAVIVLGGVTELIPHGLDESLSATSFSNGVDRVLAGFAVMRSGRAKNILISGGDIAFVNPAATYTESHAVATELRRWGIDDAQIIVESKSRNTHENAVESARIVRERGFKNVLLVTSAFHMKRAAGCFLAEGVSFDTLPVDYRKDPTSPLSTTYWPSAGTLADTDSALREYVGRLVYRVRGYAVDWW